MNKHNNKNRLVEKLLNLAPVIGLILLAVSFLIFAKIKGINIS